MAEWDLPGYTELNALGSGGSGDVVLARHDASGTLVAIKYLKRKLLADPQWVESFRTEGSTQFDRMNKIQTPFQLLVNGYIGAFTVNSGSGWTQQTADKRPANVLHRGTVGTRRERRNIPHELWINSLPQRKIVGNAQKYRQQLQTIQKRREAA